MARTFVWLGWPMSIYRKLFARQIDFSSTHTRNSHPSINPSILLLTYPLIRLLAHFFLFWLGSTTGNRPHTSILPLFSTPQEDCGKILPKIMHKKIPSKGTT